MLQNLANYFLGGTTTTNINTAEGVDQDATSTNRVALRTTDDDDGWTMVDRDSEGNSDAYSSEEDEISDSGLERVRLNRAGSNDSLPRAQGHDMEESWFVTPPPCFSSQTGPVQLRTSPLENLLIEHPSMSVYQRNGSRHPHFRTPTPSDAASEEQLETEEETIEDEDIRAEPIVVVRRVLAPELADPHRCGRAQALQMVEVQLAQSRHAQKVQITKTAQQYSRGNLYRSNKAREANSRNWHARRKERCQSSARSHANNNRKC